MKGSTSLRVRWMVLMYTWSYCQSFNKTDDVFKSSLSFTQMVFSLMHTAACRAWLGMQRVGWKASNIVFLWNARWLSLRFFHCAWAESLSSHCATTSVLYTDLKVNLSSLISDVSYLPKFYVSSNKHSVFILQIKREQWLWRGCLTL